MHVSPISYKIIRTLLRKVRFTYRRFYQQWERVSSFVESIWISMIVSQVHKATAQRHAQHHVGAWCVKATKIRGVSWRQGHSLKRRSSKNIDDADILFGVKAWVRCKITANFVSLSIAGGGSYWNSWVVSFAGINLAESISRFLAVPLEGEMGAARGRSDLDVARGRNFDDERNSISFRDARLARTRGGGRPQRLVG